MGMKQKNIYFFEINKFKMADSKKLRFSKPPIIKKKSQKISWIGPWISSID
jgi:hypothetical protein